MHHLQKWPTDVKPKAASFEQQKDQEKMCFVPRERISSLPSSHFAETRPSEHDFSSVTHLLQDNLVSEDPLPHSGLIHFRAGLLHLEGSSHLGRDLLLGRSSQQGQSTE